jgi:hypothetical protein
MSDSDGREEVRRQTHAALQRIRGLHPTEPPVEPLAQAACLLEQAGCGEQPRLCNAERANRDAHTARMSPASERTPMKARTS